VKQIVLLGRILYSLIFVLAGLRHFSSAAIAAAAAQGVPLASIAVPVSGVMALVGGLCVALGYKAKCGAFVLMAFLVPVTVMMHNFWSVADPVMAHAQQAMFVKNVALLGGALMIAYFGSGPLSLDAVLGSRKIIAMKREPATAAQEGGYSTNGPD
jgi:putative oxidoreductase